MAAPAEDLGVAPAVAPTVALVEDLAEAPAVAQVEDLAEAPAPTAALAEELAVAPQTFTIHEQDKLLQHMCHCCNHGHFLPFCLLLLGRVLAPSRSLFELAKQSGSVVWHQRTI